MGLLEIVLIILGLIIFVASFIIPEKKIHEDDFTSISEDQIRLLVEEEYENTRSRLDDIIDETIDYSMEKTERLLERLSNEKMMAMGEYSDAILDQISSNHQEVVFLHDMLNQNKNDLTVMLSQAIKDAGDAADISNRAIEQAKIAESEAKNARNTSMEASNLSVVAEEKMISARKAINGEELFEEEISGDIEALLYEDLADIEAIIEEPKKTKATSKRTTKKADDSKVVEKKTTRRKSKNDNPDLALNLTAGIDNNDQAEVKNKVLKMHKAGKSNVAIAKELGLGVGEVQLFIDLFK